MGEIGGTGYSGDPHFFEEIINKMNENKGEYTNGLRLLGFKKQFLENLTEFNLILRNIKNLKKTDLDLDVNTKKEIIIHNLEDLFKEVSNILDKPKFKGYKFLGNSYFNFRDMLMQFDDSDKLNKINKKYDFFNKVNLIVENCNKFWTYNNKCSLYNSKINIDGSEIDEFLRVYTNRELNLNDEEFVVNSFLDICKKCPFR